MWRPIFDVTIIELHSVGIIAVISRYHAVKVAFFTLSCRSRQHFEAVSKWHQWEEALPPLGVCRKDFYVSATQKPCQSIR